MSLVRLAATEALGKLHEFDSLIDARSEDEYAQDHLPNAVNWPTLRNQERHDIGVLYKTNAFAAQKQGAVMAARNIAAHLERHVADKPKDWQAATYCWRGGKRSGALGLVLDQIGFRVTLIEGGYKAFRAAMLQDITRLAHSLDWRVICGTTGSGKTRLLQALRHQGAQVLDLEALAQHRSSILGAIPGLTQPTQKHFDTCVWNSLRQFQPTQPVFVESESKKVGNVSVPPALIEAMRLSPCFNLFLPESQRVALLLEDYDFFVQNTACFCTRLGILAKFHGKSVVQNWQNMAQSGKLQQVVRELLTQHYDPVYLQSIQKNFRQFAQATPIFATDGSLQDMTKLAQELMQNPTPQAQSA